MNAIRQERLHLDRALLIPTDPSGFKALVCSIAATLLFGLGAAVWLWAPDALDAWLLSNPEALSLFNKNHTRDLLGYNIKAFALAGAICGATGLLSLLRIRLTYSILRLSLSSVYLAVAFYVGVVWHGFFSVLDADISLNGAEQDRATILVLWWKFCWPALAVGVYSAWLHAMLRSRSVYSAFTRREGNPMSGDRVLEDLRTHGRDPQYRKSVYASTLTHIAILILIPWILQLGGCITPYKVPKGSGNPVVAMVKMVKPKKKKKKTLTLSPNSAILFEIPDLDNTEADEEMKEMTELTYQANPNAAVGQLGKGGGDKGGWPEGMDDYKIRFIRLDHGGQGWDDGMHQTGADINFLRHFAQVTGFKKIARKGESHGIAMLAKYPKDGFPPFVYLTGNHNMGRVSPRDIKALRDYCLGGGMLIGDAGDRNFHNSFTHFMRQVFPDKRLLDIADDDIIYQLPYTFPDGAPAFWGHGGRRALGIKHEGRWIVFYHPGDMNDAWKLQGYTDVTPEMRDAAMNLGVNLVRYSFDHWNDAVAKARK
jgi:hypothetical protein